MGRNKGNRTVLSLAVAKSESLRTTIPAHIVRQFNLKAKDYVEWELVVEGGEMIIRVKPVKQVG